MSQVRTLHSYATELLRRSSQGKNIHIFPFLPEIIAADMTILRGKPVDFAEIFNTLDEKNPNLDFYHKRRIFYENTYGHSDVVFAAVSYLKKHPDKVPTYDQVLVDEFQDFNLLEVALIDILSTRSPILLAGDDDQALYDFKHADAKHLRIRHGDGDEFEAFNLPMCSRCTRVIVEAANDVVRNAVRHDLLQGRIDKPFEYFDEPDKDRISDAFPKITHGQVFPAQFGWFLESKLDEAARLVRGKFSVLVISPIRLQAKSLVRALRKRGFQNVEFADRPDKGISLLHGLKMLLEDEGSNLGWRIVAEKLMDKGAFEEGLPRTDVEPPAPLREIVPVEQQKTAKALLSILRKIPDERPVEIEDLKTLKCHNIDPSAIGLDALGEEFRSANRRNVRPGLRRIPIKVTTVQGSKGLADDIVFVTGADDRFFIGKGAITDRCVCNFLVSMTRAKRKLFLVSSPGATSTLVSWIDQQRVRVERPTERRLRNSAS